MDQAIKLSPRFNARLVGTLYLVVIAAGMWAQMFVRGHLMVSGDAGATAANILAHETQFRLGFAADLLGGVCYVAIVFLLYGLLKPANKHLSHFATFVGMAGSVIFAGNLLNHLAALIVLKNAQALAAFSPDQVHALAFVFLKLHGLGYGIAMLFFGLYMALIGAAILRASFLPRILGLFLVVGGIANVMGSTAAFLKINIPFDLIMIGGLSEIAFALWLFIIGVNAAKWKTQAGYSS